MKRAPLDRLTLERFLARLPQLRALVVGDLMLDEYLWGKTERISPEAPVQVVDVLRDDLRLGGAGNVVHNLAALGCQVSVASVVGDDADGVLLCQRLVENDIDVSGLVLQPGRTTSRKTRVLASNQQMLRIDRESREPITAKSEMALLDAVRRVVADCDVLLVSDYLKGVLTETVLATLIALCHERGIPIVVDP